MTEKNETAEHDPRHYAFAEAVFEASAILAGDRCEVEGCAGCTDEVEQALAILRPALAAATLETVDSTPAAVPKAERSRRRSPARSADAPSAPVSARWTQAAELQGAGRLLDVVIATRRGDLPLRDCTMSDLVNAGRDALRTAQDLSAIVAEMRRRNVATVAELGESGVRAALAHEARLEVAS
ncbi:hypothetical protein [Patulibacter defluvii]|uniref:hypothetical protein n=1 Tax=Patulibacter defluvii TaxID=3095358 RepID=UPI002A75845F|nr:hypothetical protein [Patulibacter sp. DM4]